MPSTPNSDSANNLPVEFSAAFLALRERSRVLLRERCQQLHELEVRLQNQLTQLLSETSTKQETDSESESARQRIASLESEVRKLHQLRQDSEKALDEAREMLVQMEDERRVLRDRLDASDQPASPSAEKGDSQEVERLQRRLELAMEEIRELKQQKQELGSRPAKSASQPKSADVDPKSFDWETQKKRLLQELETDFDVSQSDQAKEKLRIEEVIQETDRIIAEKDRELEELKQLLAQATSNRESSPDAAAREQMLDADATIAEERNRLKQIQEEWREKLRKSEVEISIERAKLARERLQLEEKLRTVPVQSPETGEDGKKSDDPKSGNPPRGRWLNRLGLGGQNSGERE